MQIYKNLSLYNTLTKAEMTNIQKENKESYSTRISLKKIESNAYHIFIKCKINAEDIYMIIDTGATNTIFDSENPIFADIELCKRKAQQKGFGINAEISDIKCAKIEKFSIGKFKTSIKTAILIPLDYINNLYESTGNPKIAGILGCDFLNKHEAVIDFGSKRLILKK